MLIRVNMVSIMDMSLGVWVMWHESLWHYCDTFLGRAHMEKHYADLKKKPFFKDLVDYMISGPVVCMVWEGLGAVKCGRMMLGETNPQASLPGSIRGDMSIQVSASEPKIIPEMNREEGFFKSPQNKP